jgi:hypothetical protein
MEVKAVSNVSLQQSFEGKSKRKKNKPNQSYPQMDAPASKNSANSMKNLMMGLMLIGAGSASLSSCTEAEAYSWADANAWAWGWIINNNGCNCKPDTIFQTTPIKEINFPVNDSIINQFQNIGAEVDGPLPEDGKNVILVSGNFRNRYDHELTEFQIDSAGCTNKQNMYVAKITSTDDPTLPAKWVQTIASDVPGKGIKYEFRTADSNRNSETKPEDWEYNTAFSVIVSNGARGNKPGVNTIYDKNGKMIWQGELTKGQQNGSFFYSSYALDEDGAPYIDPETGEPEIDNMNYDQAKIYTREVDWGKFKTQSSDDLQDTYIWE